VTSARGLPLLLCIGQCFTGDASRLTSLPICLSAPRISLSCCASLSHGLEERVTSRWEHRLGRKRWWLQDRRGDGKTRRMGERREGDGQSTHSCSGLRGRWAFRFRKQEETWREVGFCWLKSTSDDMDMLHVKIII
jgi:hypothetical protein